MVTFSEIQEIIFKKNKKNDFKFLINYLETNHFVKNFKQINVVGTNGKGSLTSFLAQGLQQEGYKVGTFSSPHILSITERIRINNEKISEKILEKYLINHYQLDASFFEILYIVAMLYFADEKCDFVILEAGIGGEKDCTNLYSGEFGLVTSIGLDHTEILGNSLLEIARDKAGIIHENSIFFAPSTLENYLKEIFKNKCVDNNAKYIELNINKFIYSSENKNFANKILNLILNNQKKYEFKDLFGRCSILNHLNRQLILDVSHNYQGFSRTVELLREKGINYENVIISLASSKDDSEIEDLFKDKNIFIYQNKGFKSKNISDYKIHGKVLTDIKDLLKIEGNLLIIGSFYFLPEVLSELKINSID